MMENRLIAVPEFGNMLLEHWESQTNLSIQKPISEREIANFEDSKNVTLPMDFRNCFLTLANGFNQDSGYQDDQGFKFLPLNDICRIAECTDSQFSFAHADDYFIFCEYMDFCWAYAISLRNQNIGEVILVGGKDGLPILVANDFSEFIDLYLSGASKLFPV